MSDSAAHIDAARKRFAHLQAIFALGGFELNRRKGGGFRIHRGPGWSRDVDDLVEVSAFAVRAGLIRTALVE